MILTSVHICVCVEANTANTTTTTPMPDCVSASRDQLINSAKAEIN